MAGRGRIHRAARATCLLAVVVLLGGACGGDSTSGAAAPPATTTDPVPQYVQNIHQGFDDSGRPKLQFVGDSITLQASDDLNQHFGPTYDVAISATGGYDTFLETGDVAEAAKLAPDIVVINLGTNDANRLISGLNVLDPKQSLSAIEDRYSSFQAQFPPNTCVIFVTVNTHNPSWNPAGATAINAYLESHFSHIADWDEAWSASYFDGTDDPHPNEDGRKALVATIDQTVAGCARIGA